MCRYLGADGPSSGAMPLPGGRSKSLRGALTFTPDATDDDGLAPLRAVRRSPASQGEIAAGLTAVIPELGLPVDRDSLPQNSAGAIHGADEPGAAIATFRHLSILAALVDGRPHAYGELLAGPLAGIQESNFHRHTMCLASAGLILKGVRAETGVSLQMTREGHTAFQQSAAALVALIERARALSIDPEKLPRAGPWESRGRPADVDELPTRFDQERIAKAGGREFGLAYRALSRLPVQARELVALEISDVDLAAGELRVAGRAAPVRFDAQLRRLLRIAIAQRTSGQLFLQSNGRPWSTDALRSRFKQVARAIGLAPGVRLVGRAKYHQVRRLNRSGQCTGAK